ncbi:MAG TPA: hypothetical protein VFN61_02475 [Acidimicrobiales bacterium]|nr:hypothetical protein [Acidimicrobiales bacterium]
MGTQKVLKVPRQAVQSTPPRRSKAAPGTGSATPPNQPLAGLSMSQVNRMVQTISTVTGAPVQRNGPPKTPPPPVPLGGPPKTPPPPVPLGAPPNRPVPLVPTTTQVRPPVPPRSRKPGNRPPNQPPAPKPGASTVVIETQLRKKAGANKFKLQPGKKLAAGSLVDVAISAVENDAKGVPYVQVMKTLNPDGTQKDDLSGQDVWVKLNAVGGGGAKSRVETFQTQSSAPTTTGAPQSLTDQIESDDGDGGAGDFFDAGSSITTGVNFPYANAYEMDQIQINQDQSQLTGVNQELTTDKSSLYTDLEAFYSHPDSQTAQQLGASATKVEQDQQSQDKLNQQLTNLNNDQNTQSTEGAPSAMGGDILSLGSSVASVVDIAMKLREWDKMDGWTRADAVTSLVGSVAGFGATVTDLPNEGEYLAGNSPSTDVGDASTWGSSVGGGFITAAVGLWQAFRSWWDVIATSGKKGGEAIAKGVGKALSQTLTVGKELMSAAKTLLETIGHSVGHLLQAIPGVGIAISGLKVVMRAWDLVRASMSQGNLRSDKQVAKLLLGGKTGETLKGKKPDPSTLGSEPDTVKVRDRMAGLKGKVDWLAGYEDYTIREFAQELGGLDHLPTNDEVVEVLWGRYDDHKFHQRNATKEVTRASIEVAQEVTTIGGEIATLTGVGAVAGAAIKGSVSGWKSLTSGVRWLKQLIRDKVGEHQREKVKAGKIQPQDVKHFSMKHFFTEGASKAMRPGYDPKSAAEKNKRYTEKAVNLLKEISGVKNKLQATTVAKTLEDLRVDVRELKKSKDVKEAFNVVVKVFKRR